MPFLYLFLVLLSRRRNGACFIQGFSLLRTSNVQHIKPTAIELPPISYAQEMGGSSYVDGCNLCLNIDMEKSG